MLGTPHPSSLRPHLLGLKKAGGRADDMAWGGCSGAPHVPFLSHREDLKYLHVQLAL